ncbi:MAG: cysteine synthase family protein [Candidatus Hydrogenedentota bacterium]|nr:MAG: cysteine synthase family protein [Candidatus Hydrogenedentota bacterium]
MTEEGREDNSWHPEDTDRPRIDWGLLRRAGRLVDIVGHTPAVRLDKLTKGRFTLIAKLEGLNPGGSVKDRTALAMVMDGIRRGVLTRERRILDATSGNTGIGYAWIGAALDIGVTLCVPANASPERFAILKAFGAEVIKTDPLEATDGSQRVARQMKAEDPDRWFYPDQYANNANWRVHMRTTGPELWTQSREALTHFVSVIGTTGTLVGSSRFFRTMGNTIRIVEVQPDSAIHGLEGIKHLPTVDVPEIYDPEAKDELIRVSTEEAQDMCRFVARLEGVLAGPSGGANLVAAMRVAERAREEKRHLVIGLLLPDSGTRYLHDPFWTGEGSSGEGGNTAGKDGERET